MKISEMLREIGSLIPGKRPDQSVNVAVTMWLHSGEDLEKSEMIK